jgi:RES domain-containing protein
MRGWLAAAGATDIGKRFNKAQLLLAGAVHCTVLCSTGLAEYRNAAVSRDTLPRSLRTPAA